MSVSEACVRGRPGAGGHDCFRDPYSQNTIFAAANQPLLSQLFGADRSEALFSEADADMGSHVTTQYRWGRGQRHGALATPIIRQSLYSADHADRDDFVHSQPRAAPAEAATLEDIPVSRGAHDTPQPVSREERARRVRRWQQDVEGPLENVAAAGETEVLDLLHTVDERGTVRMKPATFEDAHSEHSVEDDSVHARQRAAQEEDAKVPFFLQVREVRKRVSEQVAVHRGLNDALSSLQMLEKQVERRRAEAGLGRLLASLRERQALAWGRVFPDGFPDDTVAPAAPPGAVPRPPMPAATPPTASTPTATATVGSPNTRSNPLQDILTAFSQPRRGDRRGAGANATSSLSPPPAPPKKKLPADVVRAPEEPRPYVAYRYVLRRAASTQVEDPTYSSDFSSEDDKHSSGVVSEAGASGSLGSSSVADIVPDGSVPLSASFSVATSDIGSVIEAASAISTLDTRASESASQLSDFHVDDDVTFGTGERSSVATSDVGSTSSVGTDSIGENDAWADGTGGRPERAESRALHAEASTVSNAALVTTLREFYEACRHANAVAARLTGADAGILAPPSSVRTGGVTRLTNETDTGRAAADTGAWQALLERDVTDVRRLRRFISRLQKNLRAVDVQRKVAAARRALLLKAQALAKTRARLKRQHDAVLNDVVDSDVEDYFGQSWDSFALFAKAAGQGRTRNTQHRSRLAGSDDSDVIEESILSEVASEDFLGGRRGGSDDDDYIEDDFDFEVSDQAGDYDGVEDEIEDEWDAFSDHDAGDHAGDADSADIVDDVAQGVYDEEIFDALGERPEDGVLDEIESDVASRLAAFTDPEDLSNVVDELPDVSDDQSASLRSPEAAQRRRPRRISDDVVEDELDDVDGAHDRASDGVDSLPSLTNSEDGDVSSLYPDSVTSSRSSDRTINSREAAYWESVAGEEALQAMEAELRATKRRRLQAIHKVSHEVPTFSALYDPTAEPPSTTLVTSRDDEAENAAEDSYEKGRGELGGEPRKSAELSAEETDVEEGAVNAPSHSAEPPEGTQSSSVEAAAASPDDSPPPTAPPPPQEKTSPRVPVSVQAVAEPLLALVAEEVVEPRNGTVRERDSEPAEPPTTTYADASESDETSTATTLAESSTDGSGDSSTSFSSFSSID